MAACYDNDADGVTAPHVYSVYLLVGVQYVGKEYRWYFKEINCQTTVRNTSHKSDRLFISTRCT